MATHRTSVVATLALLLTALCCVPPLAVAAAGSVPAAGGSGFEAPDGGQLSAARELPERLQIVIAAGTSKPAAAVRPQIAPAVLPSTVAADGSAPLFLVHCAFLC